MDAEPADSNITGATPISRKDRGSVAAQACESCRTRKHKCDEKRPKCSNCHKLSLPCTYREPQPTKKDKTLVEILDNVTTVKGDISKMKGDIGGMRGQVDQLMMHLMPANTFGPPQRAPTSQPTSPFPPDPTQQSQRETSSMRSQPYRHVSAALGGLAWPVIQKMLLQAAPDNGEDSSSLEMDGSQFMTRMQQRIPKLPLDEFLNDQPFVGMQTQATRAAGGARVTFPRLTYHTMHQLATSYFDTFNLIYPFMDRQNFMSETLARVYTQGFNGDTESIISLLIFALGELALQATNGDPVAEYKGRASGLRGGTLERPPGLALFNEAQKRIGFAVTEWDIEIVQIFSLAALYYECCSRHTEFWRLTERASLACHTLISCNEIDWRTQKGDLIKRAYWHCVTMETALHLEFGLPFTRIISLEESVELPNFNRPFCEADHRCHKISHFEKHHASQLALRRLCAPLRNDVNDSISTTADTPAGSCEDSGGPSPSTLKQLISQLDEWRHQLPPELQWPEENPTVFPSSAQVPRIYNQPIDPLLATTSPDQSEECLFTPDLEQEVAIYPCMYDVQVALLRTRYYHTKYLIYRPFVYKALHFPDQMTPTDLQGVSDCLKSSLKWPVALSPPSRHKRIIPFLFCWSRNFMDILLILRMARDAPFLQQVLQHLGAEFEEDSEICIELMIDWIRDLRASDPIAAWCYGVLENIYDMESLGGDHADRVM